MSRITLIQPHTHGGVYHPPGEAIEVDDFSAQWLINNGVARAATVDAPKPESRAAQPAEKRTDSPQAKE